MSRQLKILMAYEHYPCSIARFWKRGLEALGHTVHSTGHCTEGRIGWGDQYDLSRWIDRPTYPLDNFSNRYQIGDVTYLLAREYDLFLNVDAAHWWMGRTPCPKVLVGTDPHCVTGDTLIGVPEGLKPISVINSSVIGTRHGFSQCRGIVQTKFAPAYLLENEWGMRLTASGDHEIEVYDPEEADIVYRRLDSVKPGDWTVIRAGLRALPEGTLSDYELGKILGTFDGDGAFRDHGRHGVGWTAHKEARAFLLEVQDLVRRHFPGHYHGRLSGGIYPHSASVNAIEYRVRNKELYAFLQSQCKTGRVPPFVYRSRSALGGYLNGLFATDGCRYMIASRHEALLRELQLLLLDAGVFSRLASRTRSTAYKDDAFMANLSICSGRSRQNFIELVGPCSKLIWPSQREREVHIIPSPQRLLDRYGLNGAQLDAGETRQSSLKRLLPRLAEGTPPKEWWEQGVCFVPIRSVASTRVHQPMYDVVNSETGSFLANGFSVHNCIDYSRQRQDCDLFVCMQQCYSRPGDVWIPYAYDEEWHFHEEGLLESFDVCFIGVEYAERKADLDALERAGLAVFRNTGMVFSEGSPVYSTSKLAYCRPSRQDLPARFFEAMACGCIPLTSWVPDLALFPEFVPGYHYEVVEPVHMADLARRVLADPTLPVRRQAALEAVRPHTWRARAQRLLDECAARGLLDLEAGT
jgi:hypothetical protein